MDYFEKLVGTLLERRGYWALFSSWVTASGRFISSINYLLDKNQGGLNNEKYLASDSVVDSSGSQRRIRLRR